MSLTTSVLGVKLLQEVEKVYQSILTPEAIKFLATLHRYFKPTRGSLLDFNPQTSWIREDLTWQAASPAPGLSRYHWPVDHKMVINALNSGAATYMANFKGLYTTLEKLLQPRQWFSVAPSPIPPTPSIKEEYHHPTSLGEFLNVNPCGPMAYVGVPSQGSSPELPSLFAFDDRLPLWTKTSKPLSGPPFKQEKMPNKKTSQADLGAVNKCLKDLELSNYMGLERNDTKGKGKGREE
ncbi:hypothetical protein PPACK8108_LOCUS26224 [Phakopsora pachyrhizi]|uniref:Malate synthase N-terminal domain-containing protein n=1 Tax=Phakopsora pachyrhizi TaxID=170000 RepID=A0AAV0BYV7_PHAPC|nr:hypothetical protein PPACK8108_LOCUS26224 [Phakopsora pachyrhizi]